MRRVLAAALCAAVLGACAHAHVETRADGSRVASATAFGQASASVSPDGTVAVQGGPLSEAVSRFFRAAASMVMFAESEPAP